MGTNIRRLNLCHRSRKISYGSETNRKESMSYAILRRNNLEFMQSIAKNIMLFGNDWGEGNKFFRKIVSLWMKILFVCSKIIAYLCNQSERKKIHIFKIINEKFVDFNV